MAPSILPWDRYPPTYVTSYARELPTTGYRSFLYSTYTDNPSDADWSRVTHLFTGNEPNLQDFPSRLWLDLQKGDIPLAWQSVKSGLAAGELQSS